MTQCKGAPGRGLLCLVAGLFVCLIGLGTVSPSYAQDADSAAQQQSTQDGTSDASAPGSDAGDAGGGSVAQQNPVTQDEATDGDDPDEPLDPQQSDGRFIPTEQVSQDLGVSFPIDI